jgi:hypothetical protein
MNKSELIAAIKSSGEVPNEDAAMHADAITQGDYTLATLLEEAPYFYTNGGVCAE